MTFCLGIMFGRHYYADTFWNYSALADPPVAEKFKWKNVRNLVEKGVDMLNGGHHTIALAYCAEVATKAK